MRRVRPRHEVSQRHIIQERVSVMRMTASLSDDAWHELRSPGAYEWWYFDALSDDREYGLVAIWFCGMPFSPDYNSHLENHLRAPQKVAPPDPCDYSAFSFALYHRGRPLAYSLIEYDAGDFQASATSPAVQLGRNWFRYEADSATYRLHVDAALTDITKGVPMTVGKRLTGEFSFQNRLAGWSLRDIAPHDCDRWERRDSSHLWNLVAPVCAVAGAACIQSPSGATERSVNFYGSGYHDHNLDSQPMTRAINRWHWGRCWVDRRMLVYYHNVPFPGEGAPFNCGVLFEDDRPKLLTDRLTIHVESQRRNWLGLQYPDRIHLRLPEATDEWIVERRHMVDSGPFYVRFLSGVRSGGAFAQTGHGVSETLDGVRLRRRLLRPMINTRIQRPGSRRVDLPFARLRRTAAAWLIS
jgi:carotenoid 1,2-hydratase